MTPVKRKRNGKKRRKETIEKSEEPETKEVLTETTEPEEIASAQPETISANGIDAKEIKTENISAQINTDVWPRDLSDIPVPSELFIREYLEEEEKMLGDYLECDSIPKRTILRQQLKVAGLRIIRNLVEDVMETQEEITQPELPRLKNNEERKAWLQNYRDWGVWYKDENIGATYYKYDFDNGARLIAEVYTIPANKYMPEYESCYFHLVGGPEPERKSGIPKWTRREIYNKFPNNETELTEFLKEIQKGEK